MTTAPVPHAAMRQTGRIALVLGFLALAVSARAADPSSEPALAAAGRQLYEEGNGRSTAPPCIDCHQPDGSGNTRFPRLAGQNKNDLAKRLDEFKGGRRASNAQMSEAAQSLSAEEIRALAEYIGTL